MLPTHSSNTIMRTVGDKASVVFMSASQTPWNMIEVREIRRSLVPKYAPCVWHPGDVTRPEVRFAALSGLRFSPE